MRAALLGSVVFSCMLNVLGLVGPLFMLEVYDRVIPSKSIPTLVALVILMLGLYAAFGLLEITRSRIMARFSALFDAKFSASVFRAIVTAPLKTRIHGNALRPSSELDQIRNFLSSSCLPAFFDLPWTPAYLIICFLLHPYIGFMAVCAMIALLCIVGVVDFLSRKTSRQIASAISERNEIAEAGYRTSEALAAMAMGPHAGGIWQDAHSRATRLQRSANDLSGFMSGVTKAFRAAVQSGTLALGAFLVVQGEMSGGTIIAGSIIVARALAPIDQAIPNWRGMVAAHQAWKRLKSVLDLFEDKHEYRTALPPPSGLLEVASLFVCPPGQKTATAQNVTFQARAGSVIGIIGPSASGKTSLVRGIVGVWPLAHGKVCLDGASLDQWPPESRGRHISYMPQSSELFPSTVARIIARLDPDADDAKIVAAAKKAGVHDMIVALADGYETVLGKDGLSLSAGQRQRIALARALYDDPFLVVLDEPNSNLDSAGEEALSAAIAGVKERGGIAVIAAHRNSILSQVDFLLVMENGKAKAFGPRDSILSAIQSGKLPLNRPAPARVLSVVASEGAQS